MDDRVFGKNFGASTQKWLSGVIAEVGGEQSFDIELTEGRIVRRHIDHIRKRTCNQQDAQDVSSENTNDDDFLPVTTPTEVANPPVVREHRATTIY